MSTVTYTSNTRRRPLLVRPERCERSWGYLYDRALLPRLAPKWFFFQERTGALEAGLAGGATERLVHTTQGRLGSRRLRSASGFRQRPHRPHRAFNYTSTSGASSLQPRPRVLWRQRRRRQRSPRDCSTRVWPRWRLVTLSESVHGEEGSPSAAPPDGRVLRRQRRRRHRSSRVRRVFGRVGWRHRSSRVRRVFGRVGC